MRHFKFRAWVNGRMINHDDISFRHAIGLHNEGVMILMQAVGMQDRNGVDIYEGDILDGHSDGYGKVVYEEGTASFGYVFLEDEASIGLFELHLPHVTVIGNIYEAAKKTKS